MKRVLINLLTLGSASLLMLASCKKSDVLVTTNGGTAGALSVSSNTPVLNKAKVSDTTSIITFSVTPPKYTYKAAVTNTLQIDAAGDNWKNPQSIALSTNVYTQSYSTAGLNSILLKMGLTTGVSAQVNVRVQNALSSTTAVYSNVQTLTVTPFNLTSWLYVVGSFQGWNLAAVDSLISPTGNGVYTGIINFPVGDPDFLILPQKTSYNNKYATTQPTGSTSSTVTQNAANNFYSPAAGGEYIVTLNLTAGTISFTAANFYSVIGDAALGWNPTGDDTEMKYVNDGNGNWVVTLPLASTGSFKVRQNNDWTWSWGLPKSGTAGYGVANTLNNTSNNNITVATTGTYTVSFYDPASPASTPTPASATTTYLVK